MTLILNHRVKKIARLPSQVWVGLINGLVEDLKRTKGKKIRGKSSCPTIELRHQPFSAFGLRLKNWLLLGLEPACFWLSLYHWLSWSSGLWIWAGTTPSALLGLQLWICGLLSLQIMWSNSWSQILYICIYQWFCFSEEPLPIGMAQALHYLSLSISLAHCLYRK